VNAASHILKSWADLAPGDIVVGCGDTVFTSPITVTERSAAFVRGTGSSARLPDGRPAGSFWPASIVGPFVVIGGHS
jgi:hypothetical protein